MSLTDDVREKSAQRDELDMFMQYIPGGVHKCLYDDDFTLLNVSKGFLEICGYTEEALKRLFNNHFIEIIYREDREHMREEIHRQLENGSTFEVELRIICGNKELMWILERGRLYIPEGGAPCFYCVMLDNTEQHRQKEELRASLERHQIIMDQTTDVMFEWDIYKDTLYFSQNWFKKFGYTPISTDITTSIPQSIDIHKDDMHIFVKLMEDTRAGVPYSETEFRIRDILGNYHWCRIRATVQYTSNGRPIRAIGVILDINEEKKKEQSLIEESQRDVLTGLLNKQASNQKTEKLLEAGNIAGALFMLDLDDFKYVNDHYGHLCGDALLTDVAYAIQRLFRGDDVVGRIGGDEFMVYAVGMDSEQASKKADELVHTLGTITYQQGKESVSCSVGVALYPADEKSFYGLYRCADRALYQAKVLGKNRYAFYTKGMKEEVYGDMARTAISANIDSESNTVNLQLMQYSFQMLYSSVDTDTAVNQMLKVVGRAYDVSRAYIFENSPDNTSCSNTFEWCNKGVSSEKEYMQNVSYERELKDYQKNFDGTGIFYCKDVSKLPIHQYELLKSQGIYSTLQCAIKEDGVLKGYVGFDECRTNRYWTKEQIDSLILISNILSTFLLKQRYKEQLKGEENKKI